MVDRQRTLERTRLRLNAMSRMATGGTCCDKAGERRTAARLPLPSIVLDVKYPKEATCDGVSVTVSIVQRVGLQLRVLSGGMLRPIASMARFEQRFRPRDVIQYLEQNGSLPPDSHRGCDLQSDC
jgi:hypothetical protein